MTVRDELRYEGWASQFFAAWKEEEDEGKRISSLSAHERFERLRKRRSTRLNASHRQSKTTNTGIDDSETQDISESMHRDERRSSISFAV